MLRTLLIGLDGSTDSETAAELALRWAKAQDAMLVGLGIVDEPTIRGGEAVPLGAGVFKRERDDALMADARHKVEQALQRFSLRCSQEGVACKLLEDVGLPHEQIVLEAQRYDLIILGRRTHFHFETQVQADDTLTRVLKASPRPVVVGADELPASRTVVIAYDGSLQAARTLQAFQSLALHAGHDLFVVGVHEDHVTAAKCVDRAVEYLGFHGIKAKPHAVGTTYSPSEVILNEVRRLSAGLVVMGAYGQPKLKEFLFGSVTRYLLRDCPAPLFLYH